MERRIFLPSSLLLFSSWFFIVFDLCLWFILVKLQFPVLLLWPCCEGFGQEAKGASGINKVPNAVRIFQVLLRVCLG